MKMRLFFGKCMIYVSEAILGIGMLLVKLAVAVSMAAAKLMGIDPMQYYKEAVEETKDLPAEELMKYMTF